MENSNKTALISDDDAFFRIALKSILTLKLGFGKVVETGSLDDAIEALAQMKGQCHLALFDLNMPGMESPASLKAVKDFDPQLKIAVVSGSTRRNDILSALDTGVNGYVPKGLGPADLTKALEQIIAGSVYVPSLMTETVEKPSSPEPGLPQRSDFDRLTPRQRDVLKMLVEGKATKEIATDLGLSDGTVKIHLKALFKTLGVKNRAAAAVAGSRLMP